MSPDKRGHRGAHPEDAELFAEARLGAIRAALRDLCWLLTKGYSVDASLKLVGDRYQLHQRQRLAVMRSSAPEQSANDRRKRQVRPEEMRGREVAIDGFNLIITIEAALGGGPLFVGVDGAMRDLSSIHGTYRTVEETNRAIECIMDVLSKHHPQNVTWYLDRPVSNSGKLAERIRSLAASKSMECEVELVNNPDAVLANTKGIAVSSDMVVLDAPVPWLNLARDVVESHVPGAWIIQLA